MPSMSAAIRVETGAAAPADSAPARAWAGRVVTGLPVAFLLFDTVIKLIGIEPVADSFSRLGYSAGAASAIGMLELACLAVYVLPRTSLAGAILLTGFLGGAVATHVRIGDPLFSHVLFPVYVAAMLWLGLYLRNARVAALLRSTPVVK